MGTARPWATRSSWRRDRFRGPRPGPVWLTAALPSLRLPTPSPPCLCPCLLFELKRKFFVMGSPFTLRPQWQYHDDRGLQATPPPRALEGGVCAAWGQAASRPSPFLPLIRGGTGPAVWKPGTKEGCPHSLCSGVSLTGPLPIYGEITPSGQAPAPLQLPEAPQNPPGSSQLSLGLRAWGNQLQGWSRALRVRLETAVPKAVRGRGGAQSPLQCPACTPLHPLLEIEGCFQSPEGLPARPLDKRCLYLCGRRLARSRA